MRNLNSVFGTLEDSCVVNVILLQMELSKIITCMILYLIIDCTF